MPLTKITSSVTAVGAGLGFTTAAVASSYRWWYAPGALLLGLLVVQVFEILSCQVRSVKTSEPYKWRWAAIEKGFTWGIWLCMLILDGIAHLIPELFSMVDLPFLSSPAFLPFSMTFSFIALISEMKDAILSVKVIQGANAVAADTALLMLGMLQKANEQRLAATGSGAQPSRAFDGLTKDQLAELAKYAQGQGPAPAWLVEVVPDHIPPTPEEVKQ